jgi:hypothetical protein
MKEILVGGYNFSGFIIKTDFQYDKEVRQGISDAISYLKSKVLNNINLNVLSLNLFNKIIADYSDEKLLQYAKSLFKNLDDITLEMLNIEMIVHDYARDISIKHIRSLQEKFDRHIKELESL